VEIVNPDDFEGFREGLVSCNVPNILREIPRSALLAIACCTKYILNVNTCTGAENIEPFLVTC